MSETKKSDLYETPHEVFDYLDAVHGPFDLDVCAETLTAKCPKYFCLDNGDDGLKNPWGLSGSQRAWCNPPYSDPYPWIKKATEETNYGVVTVMLLPSDISTKWFRHGIHENPRCLYYFWPKRIRFLYQGKRCGSPKFGSVIAIFIPPFNQRAAPTAPSGKGEG